MGRTRVELWGELASAPELRVTPSGLPLLNFLIECGSSNEPLKLRVMMTGEGCREHARELSEGKQVRVVGSLRRIVRTDKAGMRTEELTVVAADLAPLTESKE